MSNKGTDLTLVASLRFQIPTNDNAVLLSADSGTLNLGDVEGNCAMLEEVISLRDGDNFRVGRARSNDLVLRSSAVSRHHVVFSASNSGLVLCDLSSLNGTFHNRRKISTPVNLVGGDVVKIGNVKVQIDLHLGETDQDSMSHLKTQSAQMRSVEVTILVVDVCSFSKFSEELPAADVAAMLDFWFDEASQIIGQHGGEIDKFIGDCVMAIWRTRKDSEVPAAVGAIKAAREIIAHTKKLSVGGFWRHDQTHPWRCRAAVNTGEALMGTIGSATVRDFTVLGDTVNVAFRLEGVGGAKKLDLIFTAATAKGIEHAFEVQNLGSVILEGRTENVEIFTISSDPSAEKS